MKFGRFFEVAKLQTASVPDEVAWTEATWKRPFELAFPREDHQKVRKTNSKTIAKPILVSVSDAFVALLEIEPFWPLLTQQAMPQGLAFAHTLQVSNLTKLFFQKMVVVLFNWKRFEEPK